MLDTALVRRLIDKQFPQWRDLPIRAVSPGGWDNRSFHLGEEMIVRMPSGVEYEAKIEKEYYWLPRLAPSLPLPIPKPLGLGQPGEGYPWKWSIYQWLEGDTAAVAPVNDLKQFADDLARFLLSLQQIDTTNGPLPGAHNFYRGGSLAIYGEETIQAIDILHDKIDVARATQVWESGVATTWEYPPVWVHGDISVGNMLVKQRRLCAVIDFGGMAIGDPACDLAIAWTLFHGESRALFRSLLSLDEGTWARGRAWALWKALIVAAGMCETNAEEGAQCWRIIEEVLADPQAI